MIMRAVQMCASITEKPSGDVRAMVEWMHNHPEAFE
jgi:hypothetical protein